MNVYLDNAATTRTMDDVLDKMYQVYKYSYGNPSSLHLKGIEAEKEIIEAKDIFSKVLRVDKKEIFFTSGGTESNNLAIIGTSRAYVRSGQHIITSAFEHPSVGDTLNYLEEQGYEVTKIAVDNNGIIDLDALENAIRNDTILVSIMHVNNEIGSVQPIEKIGQIIKRKNPNTLFHVDAIQSFGKFNIYPKKWQVDCLSVSGHKIYAPKGIGALYINAKNKIKPVIYGGHQQSGIRSGTENVPGIAGLGMATSKMYNNLENNIKHMYNLKMRLGNGIMQHISDAYVNGDFSENSAPHILNVRFDDVKGEVLLHALESKDIYISTGSACSSNKTDISSTLQAIGLTNDQIDSSVRFSFSIYNTEEEIDYCLEQLQDIIPKLRRFIRR